MFAKFGKSPKTPTELVRSLKEMIGAVITDSGGGSAVHRPADSMISTLLGAPVKDHAEFSRSLNAVRNLLVGNKEGAGMPAESVLNQLTQELCRSSLLVLLVENLHRIDFENKKLVTLIFNNALMREADGRLPTVEYIASRPQLLLTLLAGYEAANANVALNTGAMLRKCASYEPLARILLLQHPDEMFKFFGYVEAATFEIASDAFLTFRTLLTCHKALGGEFLVRHYERFFASCCQRLLHSDNYVTRRQSLQLLSELLLERHNSLVMRRFSADSRNLKLMMTLMAGRSRKIQFEAFHVFKVFVANPRKSRPVLDILLRNQARLVEFISTFESDCDQGEQFNDERSFLIRQIRDLKMPPLAPESSLSSQPPLPLT